MSSRNRTSSGVFVGDVGLGLRMQDNKESSCSSSSSKRSVMVMSCHHEPAAHELSSSSCSCRGSGGGGGGPMFYSTSNHVACFGDINDVITPVSASGTGISTDAIAVSKSLQYPYFTTDPSLFTFNSSGEMTPSLNERVLFTAAQWQELERQTTIYKYMMASVPVPPELLIPITKNQSNVLPLQSHCSLESGSPSLSSSDPEPWRCKRTDGKKWRCSRNVAPDQKYCERHSHKSRPRSRKPVELHTHDSPRSMTSNNNTTSYNNNYSSNPHSFNQKPYFPSHLFMLSSAMTSSVTSSYDQPRSLEWLFRGETSPVASNSSQEWQHLKRDSIKVNDKVYNFDRKEQQLGSNAYRGGYSLQAQRLNDHCNMFLSPKSSTLERASLNPSQTQAQETRHFIDAWSTNSGTESIGGICKKSNASSSENLVLPHSALTLSMSSGRGSETNNEGNGSAPLGGFEIMGSSERDHQSSRPQWMMSHGGSWMGSPPGGPLAEALCLGISSNAKTASNLPSSPYSSSWGPNNVNKN